MRGTRIRMFFFYLKPFDALFYENVFYNAVIHGETFVDHSSSHLAAFHLWHTFLSKRRISIQPNVCRERRAIYIRWCSEMNKNTPFKCHSSVSSVNTEPYLAFHIICSYTGPKDSIKPVWIALRWGWYGRHTKVKRGLQHHFFEQSDEQKLWKEGLAEKKSHPWRFEWRFKWQPSQRWIQELNTSSF